MPGVRGQSPRPTGGGARDARSAISKHLATEFVQRALFRSGDDPIAMEVDGDLVMQVDAQVRTEVTGNADVVFKDGRRIQTRHGIACAQGSDKKMQ